MRLRLALLAVMVGLVGAGVYLVESMRQSSRMWVRMWPDRVPKQDYFYETRFRS